MASNGLAVLALSEKLFQCLDLIEHLMSIIKKLKKVNQRSKKRHLRQNCFKSCQFQDNSEFSDYQCMLEDMNNLVAQKLQDQTLYLDIQDWFETLCELTQNIQTFEVNTLLHAESHLSVCELKRMF